MGGGGRKKKSHISQAICYTMKSETFSGIELSEKY
jgi:hypothetical protein